MGISNQKKKELVQKAFEMRKYSYTPYSHFRVGAALLGKNGHIYTGCNIENAAYPVSVCAERTAIFKAVSEGIYDFAAIAIVGGEENAESLELCPPCGSCRQVMREFCAPDFEIILARSTEDIYTYTLEQLLPESFGPEFL